MKTIIFDCDSTLSGIEGIDELARLAGDDIFQKVAAMTNDAMNGKIPLDSVFEKRLEMIRPTQKMLQEIGGKYIELIDPKAKETIKILKKMGFRIAIISGGLLPAVDVIAKYLDISEVYAVDVYFNEDGSYKDFEKNAPTAKNLGKNKIIQKYFMDKASQIMFVGDGVSDLETKSDVDFFVAYAGFVNRLNVCSQARYVIHSLSELVEIVKKEFN